MINAQKLLVSLIERKSADGKSKFIYLADTISEEIDIIEEAIKYSQEWVGLTDEEVDEIYTSVQLEVNDHWEKGGTTMMFPLTLYKAIEAKLKEKNSL